LLDEHAAATNDLLEHLPQPALLGTGQQRTYTRQDRFDTAGLRSVRVPGAAHVVPHHAPDALLTTLAASARWTCRCTPPPRARPRPGRWGTGASPRWSSATRPPPASSSTRTPAGPAAPRPPPGTGTTTVPSAAPRCSPRCAPPSPAVTAARRPGSSRCCSA